MNKFSNYFKAFINDESGMELLQMAIVVVITVGLIGVVATLGKSIKEKIEGSSQQVDTWDQNDPFNLNVGNNGAKP